jgi:hypothetical protein
MLRLDDDQRTRLVDQVARQPGGTRATRPVVCD